MSGPTVEDAYLALHDVIDPELGYNIVDIGLVYKLEIVDGLLKVTMTMTTRGCPAQDYIMGGVDERGAAIPGIDDVDIELVWEPPWTPQMMSPVAKEYFGITEDSA